MKLNPKKCMFGVRSGKFLGFIISSRGIEANLDKIKAVLDMKPPQNIKEVQPPTGYIAALGRFMSRLADVSLASASFEGMPILFGTRKQMVPSKR